MRFRATIQLSTLGRAKGLKHRQPTIGLRPITER